VGCFVLVVYFVFVFIISCASYMTTLSIFELPPVKDKLLDFKGSCPWQQQMPKGLHITASVVSDRVTNDETVPSDDTIA
jgi:hypothetical protein